MLKTLKDIDSYADSQEIPLDLLQEWAREWVKEILKNFKKNNGSAAYKVLLNAINAQDITYCVVLADRAFYIEYFEIAEVSARIRWINHFFNLEEKQ
jgi:predicted RNA-binding protein with PUA domain